MMTNVDTPTVWETRCLECNAWILTDEWTSEPYFGSCECGGQASDAWQVSDEPHPSVWA